MKIEAKLAEMGIELPNAPAPLAAYIPVRASGNLVFVSGQGPLVNGKPVSTGKVGRELTIEEGKLAARACALNLIAQLKKYLGDLDRVVKIVSLRGFVACADDFYEQPQVMNGASELFAEIFGEAGQHARAALGTNALPMNIPVEVELVAEFSD